MFTRLRTAMFLALATVVSANLINSADAQYPPGYYPPAVNYIPQPYPQPYPQYIPPQPYPQQPYVQPPVTIDQNIWNKFNQWKPQPGQGLQTSEKTIRGR